VSKISVHEHEITLDHIYGLVTHAIAHRASDIHVEPYRERVRVRLRIDGQLMLHQEISHQAADVMIARVKVLAHMDVTQKRTPQDGTFTFPHQSNAVDIRVATFPTVHGEKLVLRILDRKHHVLDVAQLGLSDSMKNAVVHCLTHMHGLFLVTGPTGSGKTTTLYALLSLLNTANRHIITIEDPVEYCLDGVIQAQIYPAAGFTFEMGIRSLLRQDPDVIMIGEIRDRQTAHIAVEAALTGHLVLSTLHTHDAPSVIARLLDVGIEPFLMSAALIGIIAQRLAQRLCNACAQFVCLDDQKRTVLEHWGYDIRTEKMSTGCDGCYYRGNQGRVGIFQWLQVSEQMRSVITKRGDHTTIYEQASRDGMRHLYDDAVHKYSTGTISYQELLRVIV
jgi:type II secretory ATPase GspE/PulE/Tfp pilus assembly ATPase PilB-like protein